MNQPKGENDLGWNAWKAKTVRVTNTWYLVHHLLF